MGKVDKLENRAPAIPLTNTFEHREDRRMRGERLYVSFPILATLKGFPIQGYLEAINLSWSGMLIATNFPLNLGDKLTLEFTLPNAEVSISANARVVHKVTETFPEEATCIGVVFDELEPNTQRMISGFVLENLPLQ